MAEKDILGHVDCPACGTKGGMRVTADKNGDPFGFCDAECNAQLRIGGNAKRVAAFLRMYPWAGKTPVTEPAAPSPPEKKPVSVTVPEPEPKKPARVRVPFGLEQLVGG